MIGANPETRAGGRSWRHRDAARKQKRLSLIFKLVLTEENAAAWSSSRKIDGASVVEFRSEVRVVSNRNLLVVDWNIVFARKLDIVESLNRIYRSRIELNLSVLCVGV